LASSLGWLVAARFIDRVGKGIRGAPRDALIADLTSPEQRGASYGLRQSLDTVGAVLGPLAAMALMLALVDNFTLVFWIAVVPASTLSCSGWRWRARCGGGDLGGGGGKPLPCVFVFSCWAALRLLGGVVFFVRGPAPPAESEDAPPAALGPRAQAHRWCVLVG